MSSGRWLPTIVLLASTLNSCSALVRRANYAVLPQGQSGQSSETGAQWCLNPNISCAEQKTAVEPSSSPTTTREFALVLVNSARANFHRRMVIRSTWATPNALPRVLFLVANKACWVPPEARSDRSCLVNTTADRVRGPREKTYQQGMYIEQRRLTDELRIHGDLLFVDTIDTYRTLAQKMWAGVSWAAREAQAEWVVKFDDDVVVSLSTLLHELRRYEPHR